MLHPAEKWGCDAGQGTRNTLSTLAHNPTLSTLFYTRVGQCCAGLAHVGSRVQKAVVARWPSVFVPCLQIRLAQFDSEARARVRL